MKRILLMLIALACLATPNAQAANSTVAAMTAASALGGTELLYTVQGGLDRKATPLQMAAYVYGLMSGDATASGTGAVTLATVNANVGSFGSATNCVALTVNAKGLITAASATTCAPAVGSITGLGTGVGTWLATPSSANLASALTDETGTGVAVFGTAPTISSPTINTAATFGFITGSTQCLHVNTSGVLSGTGSDCGSGAGGVTSIASNTGAFTLNATSGITNATNDIKCQVGSASQFGCLKVDGTSITATAGVISATTGGSGTVTSVAAGCGTSASPSPITGTGTLSAALTLRSNTAASDTIVSTDCGNAVYENRATSVAVAIAQAGTAGFGSGTFFTVCNINAGTATITPTTSTIGGASTLAITAGSAASPVCYTFQSDGTNYNIIENSLGNTNASALTSGTVAAARGGAGTINGALKGNGSGVVSQAACADLSNGAAGCSASLGTGVATALAANLSAAGGVTTTIASGTSALGTGAISSATCATVVTTSATNTATTDVVLASFNGDPTAVTGYVPLTTGMLTIIAYPTANNVNFKVCNNTNSSITPGAITLNWRVVR